MADAARGADVVVLAVPAGAAAGDANEDGRPLDGFYAGDDEAAKQTVAELLTSLGFRPIDAGGLRMARSLEEPAFPEHHPQRTQRLDLAERLAPRRAHGLTGERRPGDRA